MDPIAALVWCALLALGALAWFASGSPVEGGIVVASVILAIASPSGALYAVCAAIPLIFHPVQVGSLSLGLLELGILVTALGTAIRLVFDSANGVQTNLKSALEPLALLILPAGLLVVGTLSLWWMPFDLHTPEALRTWRWVIVEPVILFGLARMAIARNGRAPLALAIAVPASAVAIAAVWQLASASSSFSVDDVHRSTATYLHPNNLALYLERALFLVFVPGLLIRGRSRYLLLGLSLVIAIGIGATFSRGALLGVAAGLIVLLLVHPFRRGWTMAAIGLGAAAAAFGLLATQRFTGAGSSGVVAVREYLWRDSLHMLRDFPLSGIGLDQFLWMHQQRYIDPRIWNERYLSHPHNLILDSWLSLGIPGLIMFSVFMLIGVWTIVMVRTDRMSLDAWQLGGLACLAAGLGHGLVDNGYFLADLAALTWLSIALVAPARMKITRTHESSGDV